MAALVAACGKDDADAPAAMEAPIVVDVDISPPPARTQVHVDTVRGVLLRDSYRWLEDERDSSATTWIALQRRYTDSVLARIPGRDSLRNRLEQAISNAPTLRSIESTPARFYLTRYIGGAPALYALDSGATQERALVDAQSLARSGRPGQLRAAAASPDGKYVLVATTGEGGARAELSIVDGVSGKLLPDRVRDVLIPAASAGDRLAWLPDGSGFIYPRQWPDAELAASGERLARGRLFIHLLRTPQAKDVPIFGFDVLPNVAVDPVDSPSQVATAVGSSWIVVTLLRAATLRDELWASPIASLDRPRAGAWRRIARVDGGIGQFALRGDTVYAITERDTDRGRIVRRVLRTDHDTLSDATAWESVLTEREGVLAGFVPARDALYLAERLSGVTRLLRLPYDGSAPQPVTLPREGTVRLHGRSDAAGTWLSLQSWASSPDWMRVSDDGKSVAEAPFDDRPISDAGGLVSTRVEAIAEDGTNIPISLVHSSAFARDGTAPLLLEGYGAAGRSSDPSYNPNIEVWVREGGVYAFAHVRGGGELGRQWHEAAAKERKSVSVGDFIAAAEHLVAERYTSAGRITALGTSLGATLPGLAIVQRPELFGAAIYDAGSPDLVRSGQLYPSAAPNIGEFGDLATPEGVRILARNSPYRRVPEQLDVPGMIVKSGRGNSPMSTPMLSAKYVARLQAANSGKRPVLWLELEDGHASVLSNDAQATAQAFAFSLWQTGHPRYQPAPPWVGRN